MTAIAYETVTAPDRSLPLLTPMSEVAGRMSIQVGATALQKANGGFGVLLGGVPGVAPARVVILGGGVAGTNATQMAVGLGAQVTVVDRSLTRLRELDVQFGSQIETAYSTTEAVERLVIQADLVIGAVLVTGAAAPKLVTRAMVRPHGEGRGHRRHLDRPGRLLRDQQADDARATRLTSSTASCTTASPTCPARCRARRPSRSPMRRCPTCVRSPTSAGRRRLRAMPGSRQGSMSTKGAITHEAVARDLGLDYRPLAV